MTSSGDLKRFLDAQERDYAVALSEIKNGRKRSHWMWYIFPQLKGLGFSSTSKFYAIKDINEAELYLKHDILGTRLIEICTELIHVPAKDAYQVLGTPDDLKLKSSMTLFSSVRNADPVFERVLEKFFNGSKDGQTLQLLEKT